MLKRRNRSKNSFESSVRLRSNRSTNSLERSEKLEWGNWFLFNEYASLDFTRIFRDHSLPISGEEFWSGFHEENSLTIQPLITHWRSCHVLQIYHQHLYFLPHHKLYSCQLFYPFFPLFCPCCFPPPTDLDNFVS